jgi:dolichyl-phosphate beta-glucosyltransferase
MTVGLVIPFYNEQSRFRPDEISTLIADETVHVYLVDDGSDDATPSLLRKFEGDASNRVTVLCLPTNLGKAEAVRQGMRAAIDDGASIVGYLDADFSTPAREMLRLISIFSDRGVPVLLGSRWLRMGSNVKRRLVRHLIGRVFATMASLTLRMPVYDTQCGAKLFSVGEELQQAFASPFVSRWAFDVELLGRLLQQGYGHADFFEEPLKEWSDVKGSKVTFIDMLVVALTMLRFWFYFRPKQSS